jgi:ABC-type Na+ efflux pump permease subunit
VQGAAGDPAVRALFLLLAGVFGVVLPWLMGPRWLARPQVYLLWLFLPVPLVVGAVAESIAGEREHHTLEPLLATRLPVRAMLAGKIAAATGFGWLSSALVMLAGLVVVNLAAPSTAPSLYSPALVGVSLGLGILTAFFTACVGISVSLHAATVRRAYVAVTATILVIAAATTGGAALLLHLGVLYLPQITPTSLALPTPAATAALILALADLALFIFATRQYRRGRLLTG